MSYITAEDIKSNFANGFDITEYLNETEQEINDVAQRLGVDQEDISTPLHYKIKRYAIAYTLMRIAQDKIGTNQPDTAIEKYKDLYALYKSEQSDLFPQLTYEMFTGNVNNIISRTASYSFYRS